jgi:hypothetical protein
MKKLLIISSLLPLLSYAASQPIPALTDIWCAQNKGEQGVHVVQSGNNTHQIALVKRGQVVKSQPLNEAVYKCYLHPEQPIGYLGTTGKPLRVLQEFHLGNALPEEAFAINFQPNANIVKYWRQHPEQEDSLIVSFKHLQTGALVAEHALPKEELRDTLFEFSSDGKTMIKVNIPGNSILWHQDVKTLKQLYQIEFEDKVATSTRFLGEQLLTNFSGNVQLYQGQKLLWSYQHPDIVAKELVLQVSPNQKLLSIGNNNATSYFEATAFAILNTQGEALLTVTGRLALPDSEGYRLFQVLDDGFVLKRTDEQDQQHYRVYNLEQQVLRTFKLDRVDTLLPPPSIHQDFYRLSPGPKPNGMYRQTLTLLQ